jgi:DNA polymerase V
MTRSPRRLFALVDCENFYVSCERLFRPDLRHRPVAVLSNNDGCVVARSEEVKALGVRMGEPFFRVRRRLAAEGTAVFSSNYELYADLSQRVMAVLRRHADAVEEYSIDEAFLALPAPRITARGAPATGVHSALVAYALAVRREVLRWTGLPVRVSIAETKTLAKAASVHAKAVGRAGGDPAVSLYGLPEGRLAAALAAIPVGDVWGVGRAYGRRLPAHGVRTALDLRGVADAWAREQMGVVGLRTVLELRGLSCIPLEKAPPARRSLVRSRSFSRPVTTLAEVRQAVATHAARAAEKLRAEGLAAGALHVFFHTGHPDGRGPHRSASAASDLPYPSNRTPDLLRIAGRLVEGAWAERDPHGRPYPYRKAGVMALGLTRAGEPQGLLFGGPSAEDAMRADALMGAVDRANRRFGRRSVTFAAEGTFPEEGARDAGADEEGETETGQPWAMRQQLRSPAYTTRWGELPEARMG